MSVDGQIATAGTLVVSDQLAQILGLPTGFNSTASLVLEFDFDAVQQSLVNIGNALAIASLSIIALVTFVLFVNRNNRVIKSASIPFLLLTIVGASFFAVAIFWLGSINASPRNNDECMLEYWLIVVGFSFLYGSLLMKNYRILAIFMEQKMQVRFIHNQWLFLAMLGLLSIDVACLWPYTVLAHNCADPQNTGAIVCLSIVVAVKAILLLAGVFVSYKSRVINIPEFNERHQLAYEFYNVFIVVLFVAPATLLIQTQLEVIYFLRLVALLIMSCVAILILFMPKFIEILRTKNNPNASQKEKSSRNLSPQMSGTNRGRDAHDSDVSRNDREDSRGGGGGMGVSSRNLNAGSGGSTIEDGETSTGGGGGGGAAGAAGASPPVSPRSALQRSNTNASNGVPKANSGGGGGGGGGTVSPIVAPSTAMRQPLNNSKQSVDEDSSEGGGGEGRTSPPRPYSPPSGGASQKSPPTGGTLKSAIKNTTTATANNKPPRSFVADDDDEVDVNGERAPPRPVSQRKVVAEDNDNAGDGDDAGDDNTNSAAPFSARSAGAGAGAGSRKPPVPPRQASQASVDDGDDNADNQRAPPRSKSPTMARQGTSPTMARQGTSPTMARQGTSSASKPSLPARQVSNESEDDDSGGGGGGGFARQQSASAATHKSSTASSPSSPKKPAVPVRQQSRATRKEEEEEEEEEDTPSQAAPAVMHKSSAASASASPPAMRQPSSPPKPSMARQGTSPSTAGSSSNNFTRQGSSASASASASSSSSSVPRPPPASAPRAPTAPAPRPPSRPYDNRSNESVPESYVDDDDESRQEPPAADDEGGGENVRYSNGAELKVKPFDVAVVFGKKK